MNSNQILPKGPKGYPIIGNLLNLADSKSLEWMQALTEQYGDVAKFKLLKQDIYLVNHPDLVKEVLAKKMDNYSKNSLGFKIIMKVLGESIFTSKGETWKRKRRIAQPYFYKKIIANLATIMTDTISEMLDEWELACQKKETIKIGESMMRLTLNIVVKTLFSTALSPEELNTVANVFTPILKETNTRLLYPFKQFYQLPLKRNTQYQKNIDQLDKIISDIVKKRRASSDKPLDLLQMLMDARDEETGEPLSDLELRDEAMTIFIAGHETTANAMSWLMVTLAQHTEIRNKIEKEVNEMLSDRIPTAADFQNLPFSLQSFKEILRLYPPVPVIPRRVEQDDMLGDYLLKGGNDVFISPYLLHRHPDFWEEPEVFDPTRFERETHRRQHPFAYLPFGGGPRICMGNNFAMMEAVFILTMITQRFRLNLLPGTKVKPSFKVTYRPKGVIKMSLEKR